MQKMLAELKELLELLKQMNEREIHEMLLHAQTVKKGPHSRSRL